MAMAAFWSCSSSAALARMGLDLQAQWMNRRRNQLSRRKSGKPCVGRSVIFGRNGGLEEFSSGRVSVTIRAVVAGDGEEVEESERPKTSKKIMPSPTRRPANLGSKPLALRPKEKVRSTNIISALMENIAGFMAPREKGDIRDVVLMSFSFALFIYISQHLVHAYCVLRHTLQPFHHF